jgi:hypothetical protein
MEEKPLMDENYFKDQMEEREDPFGDLFDEEAEHSP